MADVMTFPDDWHDFLQSYSFDDSEEIYTNGSRLIPVFRVEQLIEHLLKAQEPRVMTWQDVIGAAIECKPLYIEVKDSEDKEPGDDRWAMVTQYKDSITNGMIRAMSSYVTSEILFAEDYGKRWRCWTSRPDEKVRVETSWED